MAADVTYELTPHADSSAEARVLARDWASGLDEDAIFALELVVSELVTNAIRHGAGPITLILSGAPDGIRVGVDDRGAGRPTPRVASVRAPGGRGLRLVDRLSSDWGVDAHSEGEGKTVWAVVAVSSPSLHAGGTAAPSRRRQTAAG